MAGFDARLLRGFEAFETWRRTAENAGAAVWNKGELIQSGYR